MATLPFLALIVAALSARVDSTRITGTTLAMASGHPLAGVTVSVGGAAAVTDSTGHFILTVPAGARRTFRFDWGGQSGAVTAPDVDLRKPLQAILDTERADLGPRVDADDWHLPGVWGIEGVFARRAKGFGRFYTRDDFQRAGFDDLADLLAAEGVTHGCRFGRCGPVVYYAGQKRPVGIWIDGVIQTDEYADSLSLDSVAAVEYYPPTPFSRPTLVSSDRKWIHDTRYFLGEPLGGGMVIVWTRGFEPATR